MRVGRGSIANELGSITNRRALWRGWAASDDKWHSLSENHPLFILDSYKKMRACNTGVLKIAKVGSIPSPYLGDVEEQKL